MASCYWTYVFAMLNVAVAEVKSLGLDVRWVIDIMLMGENKHT